jgi:hypothetical protein
MCNKMIRNSQLTYVYIFCTKPAKPFTRFMGLPNMDSCGIVERTLSWESEQLDWNPRGLTGALHLSFLIGKMASRSSL